jgi:hypothetical protein
MGTQMFLIAGGAPPLVKLGECRAGDDAFKKRDAQCRAEILAGDAAL